MILQLTVLISISCGRFGQPRSLPRRPLTSLEKADKKAEIKEIETKAFIKISESDSRGFSRAELRKRKLFGRQNAF